MPASDAKGWEATHEYKYNCRGCPIQVRCVLKSHASPAMKDAMRNAFSSHTDTRQMWGILQENCLLIKQEEEEKQRGRKGSLLSQRLRKTTTAEEEAPAQPSLEIIIPPTSPPSAPPSPAAPTVAEAPLFPPMEAVTAYCLIVQPSKRRIALPSDGELVLGRFDLADVDLSYDDQGGRTVSRRHAKISGFRGTHTIEDLGSTNGTRLNDRPLELGEVAPLRPGDWITLGDCELSYEPMPAWIAELPADATCHYFLLVTPTGHRFDLPTSGEMIIGRADPKVDARPDIDLGTQGIVATCVSRKHARLLWRGRNHFLEDLGSRFGTRVNGSIVPVGSRVRLRPGDHIWLGGCVLAYDLELEQHE